MASCKALVPYPWSILRYVCLYCTCVPLCALYLCAVVCTVPVCRCVYCTCVLLLLLSVEIADRCTLISIQMLKELQNVNSFLSVHEALVVKEISILHHITSGIP